MSLAKLNSDDTLYTVDKCSIILLSKKDDMDNDDDNADKFVEISVTWDLSDLPEDDCVASDIKQMAEKGQLVVANGDQLKPDGLVVRVFYSVGGTKLADSGVREVKFNKKESKNEEKSRKELLFDSRSEYTPRLEYKPSSEYKHRKDTMETIDREEMPDSAFYQEPKEHRRHRKKHRKHTLD